jgi:hypothetical protein
MPFPFFPIGALVAGAILGAALTLFVTALMAMDRAASRAADALLPGLVSGIRGWSNRRVTDGAGRPTGSPTTDVDAVEPAAPIPVDRVRPSLH